MKILAYAAAAAVAVSTIGGVAFAQDFEASKRENVTTYGVVMIKLKFGQGGAFEERVKLLNEVNEELGMKPFTVHHFNVGPYDRMVVYDMPEGMAALDWETTPSSAAMDNALAAKLGGKEAFMEWQKGWADVTERPVTYYSHVHND